MAYLRSRDIDHELTNRGFEAGTRYILHVLAEQQQAQNKDMRLLAQSVNMMADIVQQLTTVADNMKVVLDAGRNDDDLGMSTQLLGEDKQN